MLASKQVISTGSRRDKPIAQPPPLTTRQLETAQRLRTAVARLSRLLRPTEAGTAADLTPTHVSVLLVTDRQGPIRLANVAEREGMNPTLLSRAVAHLVSQGLIKRTPDPDDRRSAWLRTTDAGQEVAERIRHQRTEAVQAAMDLLSHEDRQSLRDALPALEHLVEQLSEGQP